MLLLQCRCQCNIHSLSFSVLITLYNMQHALILGRRTRRQTDRQTDRDRQAGRQPDRQTERETDRNRDRERDRQRLRQTETERDRDRETDRQSESKLCKEYLCVVNSARPSLQPITFQQSRIKQRSSQSFVPKTLVYHVVYHYFCLTIC